MPPSKSLNSHDKTGQNNENNELGTQPNVPNTKPADKPLIRVADQSSLTIHQQETFATFHYGDSNTKAYKWAKQFASDPMSRVLFISGITGVGKSHLLRAIEQEFSALNKIRGTATVYESMGSFVKDFSSATRQRSQDTWDAWNQRYQGAELVLFDDLHWLRGKRGCMKEFSKSVFHLIDQQVKIAFASIEPLDRLGLSEEMKGRLMSGMSAEISEASLSECAEQLQFRARLMGMDFTPQATQMALDYGARTPSSIGAVLRSVAGELINDPKADQAGIIKTSNPLHGKRGKITTVRAVLSAVAENYEVTHQEILGKTRTANLVEARHVAMYLAREHTTHSLVDLAAAFKRKSHSTIDHGWGSIKTKMQSDSDLQRRISRLLSVI